MTDRPMHINQWWGFEGFFTNEECDQIAAICESVVIGQAGVISSRGRFLDRMSRNCKSGWLTRDDGVEWLYSRLQQLVLDVNKRTLKFDLEDGQMEALQYLEYGFGQFYDWHTDSGADQVAQRKWTIVVQLSDKSDYVGGKTEIDSQARTRHAPRGRGSVAIFPSHLRHKAHPVWIGKRKALVAWIRGKRPLS